jgi:hypothetical protein
MIRSTLLAAIACALVLGAAGCDNRGPAEKVGDKIDTTVDTIKNGGHETAADSIKDDVHSAQDKVDKAAGK